MRRSRSRPDFVQCVTRSYIYDAPFTVYARLCSVCYKELYLWLACQPGVARAFALRAELRRFAPPAGSAHAAFSLRDHSSQRWTLGKIAVTYALPLAALSGHLRFARLVRVLKWQNFALLCTCVSFEKSQLRLVRKGSDVKHHCDRSCDHTIDHARFDFEFFNPTDPRNTDRPNHKVATKLSAFTKSLHFQSIVVGADFERQERQESFRAWTASKGMFTDSYSYWQRTTDRGWAASKGMCTDNSSYWQRTTDTWTVRFWTYQTTKPRKLRNHESVLKSILIRKAKKGFIFKVGCGEAGFGLLSGTTWFRRSRDRRFDERRAIPNFGDSSGRKHVRHDDSSYWQRTVDTWMARFWNVDGPNHKTTKVC